MHGETGEIDGIQTVQHELFQTYVWCCAVNDLGRECTSLFTIGNFPLRFTYTWAGSCHCN